MGAASRSSRCKSNALSHAANSAVLSNMHQTHRPAAACSRMSAQSRCKERESYAEWYILGDP